MHQNNIPEIEKEEVEFPVLCHLVAKVGNIRWQDIVFNFMRYTVQLRIEDCTILQICSAVGP